MNPPRKYHFFFDVHQYSLVVDWLKDNAPWKGTWTSESRIMYRARTHNVSLLATHMHATNSRYVYRVTLKNFRPEELAFFKLTWSDHELKTRNGTHLA